MTVSFVDRVQNEREGERRVQAAREEGRGLGVFRSQPLCVEMISQGK